MPALNGWAAAARATTIELVRRPSTTGSPGEAAFAGFLVDHLASLAPLEVRLEPIDGDPRGRANVFALARGPGAGTLLLCGHFDTVGHEGYGALADLACDPLMLLPRLIEELEAGATGPDEQLALDDLRSGDFLPGRGCLDMKSGIAAGITVLRRHLAEGAPGNLLLVATPDEEQSSAGMRAAAKLLPRLAADWGLQLLGAINLDSGEEPAAYLGSVGKLLPSVFVVGRETHAGRPFEGINADLVAAEITRAIECNPELADRTGGGTQPPITLRQSDQKERYDVTTPVTAWCLYNFLSHQRPPVEVLTLVSRVAAAGLASALDLLAGRAAASGQPARTWQPRVMTFSELAALAPAGAGTEIEGRLRAEPPADIAATCRRVTELMVRAAGLTGPLAVVGFASVPYPAVAPQPAGAPLREALGRQGIQLRDYFSGISDMSFVGVQPHSRGLEAVLANTPVGLAVDTLGIPVVNLGPWGRDVHHRLERVNARHAFEVLPEQIWRVTSELLGPRGLSR